jgi:acetyl-CoA acetyltransferase family protein
MDSLALTDTNETYREGIMTDVRIPHGAYWSTPFVRWQGSFANLHSLRFAADTATKFLSARKIPLDLIDHAVLGTTVPQEKSFWGVPWVMSLAGAHNVTGPTIAQACATSVGCLSTSAAEVEQRNAEVSLVLTCDRTSNSPVVIHPNPRAPSGAPSVENWVLDNFREDPNANVGMVETAENCAREWQISTEEQHDLVVRRYEQYLDALAGDRAFQRRYMMLPFEVPDPQFRKVVAQIEGDEGVHGTTRDGLAKLKPVIEGGTVTFGGQTHPADGNAGMMLVKADRAGDFTSEPQIDIRILGFGQAREKKAYMPAAPVKAARRALEAAGLAISDIDAIKSHNPFAVNDIVFARETGANPNTMNNFGSSLIYGHPQGPTGLRIVIELIEELVMRGGGHGLFHGCAAGDSAMAVVLQVRDRRN